MESCVIMEKFLIGDINHLQKKGGKILIGSTNNVLQLQSGQKKFFL